jgi:uncharacterized iron-regulated membrane protein
MAKNNNRKKKAKLLRVARKIHRTLGAFLFVFFILIAVTGVLLGWKKNTGGIIQSKSYTGVSTNLKNWLPIDSLHTIACNVLRDSISADLSTKIDRIDLRKNKGMVKFIFADHFWGVQIDGTTGQLLHIEKRHSDLIEKIHDGSILDDYLGTKNDQIKLFYTLITGLSLLTFSVTGFWLWYGPKRMKKKK